MNDLKDVVIVKFQDTVHLMVVIIYARYEKRLSKTIYPKVSNIRRTLVDNTIVDHSDVVGASPVGTAPTTSSFST